MILHIHSDCVYTRYGISDLARNFLNNSNHNETIHVFDLSRNSHPLELSKRVKIAQQQSIGPICKIIVICDENTALLLRQYNIMCISKSESIMNWVGFFCRVRKRKWEDIVNIWRLERFYAQKNFSQDDVLILGLRINGFSFPKISEMSDIPLKTIYSRYNKMKNDLGLNRGNIIFLYDYITSSNSSQIDFFNMKSVQIFFPG